MNSLSTEELTRLSSLTLDDCKFQSAKPITMKFNPEQFSEFIDLHPNAATHLQHELQYQSEQMAFEEKKRERQRENPKDSGKYGEYLKSANCFIYYCTN